MAGLLRTALRTEGDGDSTERRILGPISLLMIMLFTLANSNRLAFDLGKCDIRTIAVKDDEVLHSQETE